jgi:fatty-acyl-CoA synthase
MRPSPIPSLWIADPDAAEPQRTSIGAALRAAAQRWPQREAVVYACQPDVGDVRWTYAQLDADSDRLAAALLARGYTPGERVAIWGPIHPHWIWLDYALAKAGLTIVALNPLYKRVELTYALNTAKVTCIFHADRVGGVTLRDVLDQVRAEVTTLRDTYSFTEGVAALLQAAPGNAADVPVDPDGVFMIQYTSGTTGTPKAAQLSHAAVATIARNSYRCWHFDNGARVCHGFPLFHVGGSGNSTPGAMMVGATTLPLHIFKARQTLDILEQERCSGFLGVPTMLTAMLEDPSFASRDLSALECIILGGAPVPLKLLRDCEAAFGARIINGYGQTETCGVTSSTVAEDSLEHKTRSSGKPLPGISIKIVDGEDNVVPRGDAGELCYNGPGKMLGYANADAAHSVFDADGWLRTGDLATMDADGYVSIVGRAKDMIIRGGENLSPAEIENYLLEHPDVIEAAVIGLPDERYGEEVCAVLRAADRNHAGPEQIRAWCAERISRWKVPRYVVFIDAMPMTPSGKIKKFELREMMARHFNLDACS